MRGAIPVKEQVYVFIFLNIEGLSVRQVALLLDLEPVPGTIVPVCP